MSRLILAPLGWKSNVCIFVTFLSLSLSLSLSLAHTLLLTLYTHTKQHIYCFWFLFPFPCFLVFDFLLFLLSPHSSLLLSYNNLSFHFHLRFFVTLSVFLLHSQKGGIKNNHKHFERTEIHWAS
jgi:hypothetical protein